MSVQIVRSKCPQSAALALTLARHWSACSAGTSDDGSTTCSMLCQTFSRHCCRKISCWCFFWL